MSVVTLPPELQKLVVDHVEEDSYFDDDDEDEDPVSTLQSCALVCKSWHTYALRRLFAIIKIPGYQRLNEKNTRWDGFLQLMEINPAIGESIHTLSVTAFPRPQKRPSYSDETLEKILQRSTNVVNLLIQHIPDNFLARPNLVNGFSCISQIPSLQHVSIQSNTLRTSLFDSMSSIKFLRLTDVVDIVVDHRPSTSLQALEKLEVYRSRAVIKTMQSIPSFRSLFDHIQHFHMHDEIERLFQPWDKRMDMTRLTSLNLLLSGMHGNVHFFGPVQYIHTNTLTEIDAETILAVETFPWSSAQQLSSLTIYLDFARLEDMPVALFQPINTPAPRLLLTGPSTLPLLQKLHVTYFFPELIDNEARLDEALQELFKRSLDPTFGKKGTFLNLKEFNITVEMSGTSTIADIDDHILEQRVMQQLQSVFGPGGRRRDDGWKARVSGVWNRFEEDDEFGSEEEW